MVIGRIRRFIFGLDFILLANPEGVLAAEKALIETVPVSHARIAELPYEGTVALFLNIH